MSDVLFSILVGSAIIAFEILVLALVQASWFREIRIQTNQILDTWRLSAERRDRALARSDRQWKRSHEENMAFHRDHAVALRAILERVDRDR